MSSLFLHNIRQHLSVCAKMISSWARKILLIAKVHMSADTAQNAVASGALRSGVSLFIMGQSCYTS